MNKHIMWTQNGHGKNCPLDGSKRILNYRASQDLSGVLNYSTFMYKIDIGVPYDEKETQNGIVMHKQYQDILKTMTKAFQEYDLTEFFNFLDKNDMPSKLEYSFRKNLLPLINLETSEGFLMQMFVEEQLLELLLKWLKRNRLTDTKEYAELYHRVLIEHNHIKTQLLKEKNFYGNRDNIKQAVKNHCKKQNVLLVTGITDLKLNAIPMRSIEFPLYQCPHCGKKSCATIAISGNPNLEQSIYVIEFICLECRQFSYSSSAHEIWEQWIRLNKETKNPDYSLLEMNLDGLIFDKTKEYLRIPRKAVKLVLNESK